MKRRGFLATFFGLMFLTASPILAQSPYILTLGASTIQPGATSPPQPGTVLEGEGVSFGFRITPNPSNTRRPPNIAGRDLILCALHFPTPCFTGFPGDPQYYTFGFRPTTPTFQGTASLVLPANTGQAQIALCAPTSSNTCGTPLATANLHQPAYGLYRNCLSNSI